MSCVLSNITKKHLILTFCIAISLLFSACTGASVNVKGDFTYPVVIQVDDWVKRNPPMVYIFPKNSPTKLPKALFIPFKVTQDMQHRSSLGKNVSRQFWNTWLSQQAFDILEFYDPGISYSPERALIYAKQKNADLVVGGYITHYMDGGTAGDSYASISIEIYEVATGALLWSMAQAGTMEKQVANDFYLFKIEKRLPADPMGYIISILAEDMGAKVHAWTKPNENIKQPLFEGQVF